MRVTLESTTKTVEVNGVPARIWQGRTTTGIRVHAFIVRIGVHKDDDQAQFRRELVECRAPSRDVAEYPAHLVL